jgi:type III secretion protein L
MGLHIQVEKSGLTVTPETKILKAEEYRKLVEAEQIIAEADKRAEQILLAARTEYEKEKKQGYRDGLQAAKMAMSERMIEAVTKNVEYLASTETKITDLINNLVGKVIGAIDDRELIVRLVKKSLAKARAEKQVRIHVNRNEVETVNNRLDDILKEYPNISFLEVVGDKKLEPGSCILESETGTVDTSIDVQLTAIQRSLAKSFKERKKR